MDEVTTTVGAELINEIEKVSAKRARWVEYSRGNPEMARACAPAQMMMQVAIKEAKEALQSDDPAKAIRALEQLRGFDSED